MNKKHKRTLLALFCIFGPTLIIYLCIGFIFWAWNIPEWIVFKPEKIHNGETMFMRFAMIVGFIGIIAFGFWFWDENEYSTRTRD